MSSQADRIKHYYEANTKRFLRYGQGRGTYSIHRALDYPLSDFGQGKFNRQYSLIARKYLEICGRHPRSVLDLGCGVGGGLATLADQFPVAHMRGVSLSGTQVLIARTMLQERKLSSRVQVVEGDFCKIDLAQTFDLICAVESAILCEGAKAFFEGVRRHAHEGTILIIIDDFIAEDALCSFSNVEMVREFWRAPALERWTHFHAEAQDFECLETLDLTDYIELQRPRDRLIQYLFPLLKRVNGRRWPFLDNMIGGHCLQQSLLNGDIKYYLAAMRF